MKLNSFTPIIALTGLLTGSLLLGALMSYPVYLSINLLFDYSIDKAIKHASILSGFVLICYFLKKYRLLNKESLGFNIESQDFFWLLIKGFALGIFIMAVTEFILIILQIHGPDARIDQNLKQLGKIIISALFVGFIVSVLEEILFRGLIISYLKGVTGSVQCILYSALLYSSLHYLSFPKVDNPLLVGWLTGISHLPTLFSPLLDIKHVSSFSTVFALGLLLAIIRLRDNSIAYCIGLHAGLVMLIKISSKLTDYQPDNPYNFLVSSVDHKLGLLATLIVMCFVISFWRQIKNIH